MMSTASAQRLSRFQDDDRGTIAIIFSLAIFVVILMVGLAIDIGRVLHANSKLSSAIDSAALAAAKAMRSSSLTDEQIRQLVTTYFDANMGGTGGAYAKINSFTVNIDRAQSSVGIDLDAEVPMIFAQAAGVQKIALPASTVAIYSAKDIELSVQLDLTGSMCSPCSKIDGLKDAMNDLLDVMLPDAGTPNKVRVALAPFAASVNAGDLAELVTNNRSPDHCVYERDGADQSTDTAPARGTWFKVAGDTGVTRTRNTCPTSPAVVPLSSDKAMLRREISGYGTYGSTAGHLGTAWAWYMLSPKWASLLPTTSQPVAYNDGKTIKTAILMTDGIYNTVGGVNGGDVSATATASQKRAEDLCANMKNAGVIVYTIGFDFDHAGAAKADAIKTLSDCASSASKFYRAERPDELRAAFRAIAEDITNLRLSK